MVVRILGSNLTFLENLSSDNSVLYLNVPYQGIIWYEENFATAFAVRRLFILYELFLLQPPITITLVAR
jgi:hypothetical protein